MNLRALFAIAALTATCLSSSLVLAEGMTKVGRPYESNKILRGERLIAGPERGVPLVKTGIVDSITVPVTIAQQVRTETQAYGPLGAVSGVIRGGIKGGVQLIGGALRGTIGVLDVASTPMGEID